MASSRRRDRVRSATQWSASRQKRIQQARMDLGFAETIRLIFCPTVKLEYIACFHAGLGGIVTRALKQLEADGVKYGQDQV